MIKVEIAKSLSRKSESYPDSTAFKGWDYTVVCGDKDRYLNFVGKVVIEGRAFREHCVILAWKGVDNWYPKCRVYE